MKKTLIVILLIIAGNTFAMPVEVTHSLPVTSQVVPALTAINATLAQIAATEFQIGSAINQNSDKLAAMIEETAKTQRDFDTFARKTARLETARRSYTVPDSVCSESAAGMATTVATDARAMQSRLAGGRGIANKAIQTAITTSAEPVDQEQFRAAAIHANYCSTAEHAVLGGTPLCPKIADQAATTFLICCCLSRKPAASPRYLPAPGVP